MSALSANGSRPSELKRPTVLLVDDDVSFIASLEDALSQEPYDLLLAHDGKEALGILGQHHVDLVVTDVRMPKVDGITLVAELSQRSRAVPCIVMTAFGTPELEGRLDRFGIIEFIDKPLDVGELRLQIRLGLEQAAEESFLHGLPLTSFLQLLALEKKTCTLRIKRQGETGLLFLRKGKILDASLGSLSGSEAALELVTWDHAEISVTNRCRIRKRQLEGTLEHILLEAMRLKDERQRRAAEGSEDPFGDTHLQSNGSERRREMELESYLLEFKDINGYLASGIMDFTGETLATNSVSNGIDLEATGATFNDIFRSAHEASKKIGLEACRKLSITTPKGVVVMECSGVDSTSHLHFIVVLKEDGNQALARKTLERIVPQVVAAMS